MNSIRRFLASIALVALVMLWPATAMAAPVPWALIEVAIHSEESGGVVVASGELPAGTTLPAEAEMSVPKGMEVAWIGQILGGDPSKDLALQYTKTTIGDADVYRFTMTESLVAQLELPVADAATFNGTDYDVALKWISSQDVPEVRLMAQIPQPATIVRESEGATVQPVTATAAYYAKTITNVKAGDALDLTFGYSVPAGASGTVTPGSTDSPATGAPSAPTPTPAAPGPELPIAIALALMSMFVVGYFVLQGRRSTGSQTSATTKSERKVASEPTTKEHSVTPSEDEGEDDEVEPQRMSARTKRNLITGVIVASFILVGVVVGTKATTPQVSGGQIVQTFSAGAPCSSVVVPVNAEAAGGPEDAAAALFEALGAAEGINDATLEVATSELTVGFCESSTNEEAVRGVLQSTGLVAQ